MSMLGAFIILFVICVTIFTVETVIEYKEKKKRQTRYILSLENKIRHLERTNEHYRIKQLMEDIKNL